MPPPYCELLLLAKLAETVQLVSNSVPPLIKMPPPPSAPSAIFPDKVQLLRMHVLASASMPPPPSVEPLLLPDRVQLFKEDRAFRVDAAAPARAAVIAGQRATIESHGVATGIGNAAAALSSRVIREVTIVKRDSAALVVNPASLVGRGVTRKRAVVQNRCPVIVQGAAVAVGKIGGKRATIARQYSVVVNRALLVVVNGTIVECEHGPAIHGDSAPVVATNHRERIENDVA
jgi:hypothetical protein